MVFDDYNTKEQIAQNGLDEECAKHRMDKCQKKVLDFYKKNKNICNKSLKNFEDILNNPQKFIEEPMDISPEDFNKKLDNTICILLMTANEIECNILLWNLYKFSNKKVEKYIIDDGKKCTNINLCNLGIYTIIHKHAEKIGDEYTRRAINSVTNFFEPDFIVLLGVCYGLYLNKHEIGMVSISEQVTGVRINFRDKKDSEDIIFQPDIEFECAPNSQLLKRVTTKINGRRIVGQTLKNNIKPLYGRVISANSLMSCKKVKESILSDLSIVRGRNYVVGEMEACGIFKADINNDDFNRWLVIKAICDWGESKNSLVDDNDENEYIKNSLQAYAMMNSCELLKFLFDKNCFNK